MTEHTSEQTGEPITEPTAGPTNAYDAGTGEPSPLPVETAVPLPPEAPEPPTARSGFHPVNIGHLVIGLAFVGLAFVWLLVQGDTVDPEDHGWVFGLPWLAAGAVGLAATVLTRTRRAP
ncbi:MAG TPA: hypothetical protein VNS81_01030 [Nocardioides sp.]|nr:hypothetical protein [Nocardioides sp.]